MINEQKVEAIRIELATGNKIKVVADKYGSKPPALKKLFSAYEWEQFKKARVGVHARGEKARLREVAVVRRKYPAQKERKVLCFEEFVAVKAMRGEKAKQPKDGKAPDYWGKKVDYTEMIGEADLWFYQNDPAMIGTTLLPVENDNRLGLRSYASQNIPFIEYNSARRIHDITHAIFQRKGRLNIETDTYELIENWVELLNPDPAPDTAMRHDVDTLNAKIGFAETLKDRLLTQEDGCIISKEFAERGTYRFLQKVHFLRTEDDLKDVETVKAGDTLSNIDQKDMVDNTIMQYSGEITMKPNHQLSDNMWLHHGILEVVQPLNVGDKLRSLSAMKCIIAEVREGLDCDILIHPNQIVKDTPEETKGAFIMELRDTGGFVMVGMRSDEIGGMTVNIGCGSSLSAYLYPVLKIWASDVVKAIVKENAVFSDYMRALHLRYDLPAKTIVVTSPDREEGKGYKDIPHYQWRIEGGIGGYHNEVSVDNLSDVAEMYPLYEDEVISGGGGKTQMNHLRWEKLFIPEFAGKGHYSKTDWEKPAWKKYEGKPFNGVFNPLYEKKWVSNEEKRRGIKSSTNMDKYLEKKGLFPKIREGMTLTAIPTTETDKITLSSNHKEKFGNEVLIWREPVVGKNNVFSMPVIYRDELPVTCVKIPLDVIKAANGDTDGDPWGIAPYSAPELRLDAHTMPETIQPNMLTIDYETVQVVKRDVTMMQKEAMKELNAFKRSRNDTKMFGGLRKRASFSTDSVKAQIEILKYGYWAEVDLKPERMDYDEKKKAEDYYNSIIACGDKEFDESILKIIAPILVEKKGKLVKTQKINPYSIIGAKPTGFWFDLLGLPISEEDQRDEEKMAVLKSEKVIRLWNTTIMDRGAVK